MKLLLIIFRDIVLGTLEVVVVVLLCIDEGLLLAEQKLRREFNVEGKEEMKKELKVRRERFRILFQETIIIINT